MPPGQDMGDRQTDLGDALSSDFDIVVNPFRYFVSSSLMLVFEHHT